MVVNGVVMGLFTELTSSYAIDMLNRRQITHLHAVPGRLYGLIMPIC